ncbi:3-deoxy-manno-octulosonate-8-phosphatase KdsC [Exilibacterium tricleocarpae]|uniref:3-deoxy-D-manno-octulosonate 8-phosphate phosphatase KdsC n=1 Tax=Exilibacterium tricleocarpae TaxID=2591008 RepID=A0A545TSI3_9GAMM|nr:3-deoxy-manno-octulosonate-8-phosphatase KdsC [Exilibacterium tricleocarpae]TQV80177.1 3-deoxy-manno-octulosonate-8-phosphatase KdsC [Exilibacterium tricleocarpae]
MTGHEKSTPTTPTAATIAERARNIRLLLLDVDGVMTDGKLYFGNDGTELKAFNILDGHGIKMLQKTGVKVGIITGRKSELVARRAANLGIELLVQGREDKLAALHELIDDTAITLEQIAFMGDDYPDLAVIRRVGLGLTVANAHPVVRRHAAWQSENSGGEGAVREACDMIMQAQNTFEQALAEYL